MKSFIKSINYNYNLYPNKLYKKDENNLYFFIGIKKIYINEIDNDINLEEKIRISNYIFNRGIKINTFIKTKFKKDYVEYKNKKYVLTCVNIIENEEISLREIKKLQSIKKSTQKRVIDRIKNWQDKVDKLENKMLTVNDEYKVIQDSINYYIGIAENAIQLCSTINKSSSSQELVPSHDVTYENFNGYEFYNPLNIVFDNKSIDYANYVKNKLLNNRLEIEEIYEIIDTIKHKDEELIIFVSNLLYPNYYLDTVEAVLLGKVSESKIMKIIDGVGDYEDTLVKIVNEIYTKNGKVNINWLK